MKKCFYFPTWEEQKDIMISLNERTIDIPFAKNGFNLTKDQEFIGSHMEVELSHSLDYNRVYRGNLQLVKGSSVKSQSEQEFTEHQNKYQKFKDNFDKLYNDYKVEFIEGYRTSYIRFVQSITSDPILAKLCKLTGAKMYRDYIVLEINVDNSYEGMSLDSGDVVKFEYTKILNNGKKLLLEQRENYFISNGLNKLQNEIEYYVQYITDTELPSLYKKGNIFHEYSKFLRKEENKWEEVKKILGI